MNWILATNKIKPQIGRAVLCYCPQWCSAGYQVAVWNGKDFEYEDQPNNSFGEYVESWSIFLEAD